MGGKTSTSTSTVQVPQDVLARYNAVNTQAQAAANTPFQQYSTDPNAFVAPLTGTQQAGIQNTNTAANQAQPYYSSATGNLLASEGMSLPNYSTAASDITQGQNYSNNFLGQSNDYLEQGAQQAYSGNLQAEGLINSGTQAVNAQQIGADQINQFMSPYLSDVVGSESALLNQNNQQAMAGQLGNAITSGAFGGDRAGIAAANLSQQQNLANANIYSGLLNTGYNTALGAAQQQQGVNLGAAQANRAAIQTGATQEAGLSQQAFNENAGTAAQYATNAAGVGNADYQAASGLGNISQGEYNIGSETSNSLAGLGAGAQSAALQGATAQLTAGQQEQATQQAGQTALYNQFLQQQAYPFQTAQFAANVAEGTGSLSGSTTSTTQPTGLFGNLLSDRRAKTDIREMGRAKNGLKIYSFKYKGDPEKVTHIGFMADEVEKKHPEAVGLAGGLKTVDYDRASKSGGGGLVFDPNSGEYGLGSNGTPGSGTYVPAPQQSAARRIAFQHSPTPPQMQGLGQLANQYQQMKGLYNDGTQIYDAGKSVVSGLGAAMAPTYSHGGLALKRDDGGYIDDPYQSDAALQQREKGLAAGEKVMEQAPNSSANGPVSSALASQAGQPKYTLNPAQPAGANSNNSANSNLQTIGTLAKLGSDAAPYAADAASSIGDALAMVALKSGGLVPREHHADGDSVGDDNINPHGDAPVDDALSPEAMIARQRVGGLAPPSAHSEAAPKTDDNINPHGDAPVDDALSPEAMIARQRVGGLAPPSAHSEAAPKTSDGISGANAGFSPLSPMISPDDVNAQPTPDPDKIAPGPKDIPVPPDAFKRPASSAAGLAPPAAATANVAPSAAQAGLGAWAAPTYDGARPSTAPEPSAYGTDQAGQAAFIRDYSIYRGVKPEFALGVANTEGLRAISPKNPNGASSVDIDPQTGKPFSFGAFQLNVRNGLGNEAMAKGIDPTNPAHANLANQFAIDQMATGGLKPWRGDAVVKAYQQGINPAPVSNMGGGGGQPQATPAQQPGLFDSLGKFFHGQPDGQSATNGGMGERALMGVLSGLGAVGSYRGQSVLGAALQGLGAGAKGYMDAGKTQADIAREQAETQRTGVAAARESVLDNGMILNPKGNLGVVDKRIATTGVPLMGGVPNAANKQGDSTTVNPSVTPPISASGIDLRGVGYNSDSANRAKNEVLSGPQAPHDIAQSAAYLDSSQKASQAAQETSGYTRTMAATLADAYQQTGMNAAGPTFSMRAGFTKYANELASQFGMGNGYFGEGDKGAALEAKINALQGAARAQGADEHTLGALNVFKGANASLDQPPEASSEISARLMTDQMRAQDRYKHALQWKSDSPMGTSYGAADDFSDKNGPQKYDLETKELQDLMLNKGQAFSKLTSGKYSPQVIDKVLRANNVDPNLARYFVRGGNGG